MTLLLFLIVSLITALVMAGAVIQIGIACALGLVAGAIARKIFPGDEHMSLWQTVLLGVCGGLLGSAVLALAGLQDVGIWWGIAAAVAGSLLLLWLITSLRNASVICLGGLFCVASMSGCAGYRLGLGPQRVAQAGFSGPVVVDLNRPNTDLPAL